nr:probable E3 ubiquitin-protein ligase HERC4 [Lytechinus pictus]
MVGFFERNFWANFDWLHGLGPPPPGPSMVNLTITVDRKDIFGKSVQEQLAEMLNLPMSLLRRPLKVVFVGEAGVDLGALSMEFFRLAFKELLDPDEEDFAFVRYIDTLEKTNSFVWFRKECRNSKLAKICGLLFGLSLYNKAIVPLPFPQLLYAKLLGKGPKTEMEELAELDKKIAKQMCKLQSGTEQYVKESCFGMEIELEDGTSVDVTKENVHRYVDKKIKDYLVPSQFAAFQRGFHKVFHPTACEMFRPIELETLVLGEKHFDWKALEQSTKYTLPYTSSHSTITMFWTVFHDLEDGLKRKFLGK